MKESRYNFFFESEFEDKLIAYNCRSNYLALIEKEKRDKIPALLNGSFTDYDLMSSLKEGGFIVDDDLDELGVLRHECCSQRYSTASFGMTICPTLACNFDCVYCFESSQTDMTKMSVEVQDKIIKIMSTKLPTISNLNVSWFGGEPLLAFDVIERMSKIIMNLCEKANVEYGAGIITNGYLLDVDTAKKMKELKINNMQVTLDCNMEVHDRRRTLRGGQGTFKRIVENLESVIDIYPNISLRVNVDKTNKEHAFEIFDVIKNSALHNKITPYLGYVDDANNCYKKEACLEKEEFLDLEFEFDSVSKEMGYIKNILHKYPRQFRNFCGADGANSFVVDCYGYFCKCWDEVGIPERRIGNVTDEIIPVSQLYLDYTLYDATTDPACSSCKVLPLCMGGCPKKRLNNLERCSQYKYTLEKYIKILASNIVKRKKEEAEKEENRNA